MRHTVIAASVLLLSLLPSASEGGGDQIVRMATRPNVTETVVLVRPSGKPTATLVVFVGGAGKLDLTPRGLPTDTPSLFVKRRAQLADRGFMVTLLDAPSDRPVEGLLGFRTSAEHAIDVGSVIARLRHDDAVPVWLVGMSMGTVSAASATARLGRNGPDGLVLISSVTRTHPYMRESLGDVPLESIRVPILIVHHRHDECETARYDDASTLPRRLAGAKRVELVTLDGGPPPRGLPCGPESPHAFLGIEDVLIDRLASWITRAPVR